MSTVVNTVHSTLKPTDNPFLNGAFRPSFNEHVAHVGSLKVIGEIPRDLDGIYIRNTHNQVHEPMGVYHPFDGDGMLHAVHFQNGQAAYRSRFVRTTGFLAEQGAQASLWTGILEPDKGARRGWGAMGSMKDNAGTDIICHAGKLLATMSQGSEPWRLDPISLDTQGPDANWARHVMPHGIGSHYKVDPETGEMMFFNYPEVWPYMHYGVVDRHNQLVHYVPVELPGARWPHDLGITKNYTILHDTPQFFDPELLKKGVRKLAFHPEVPARFGVIPRRGSGADVKWFEATSCHILHLSNCYEDGDEIVMDGCIMPKPVMHPVGKTEGGDVYARMKARLDKHNNPTMMHRWRFNLRTGQTAEQYLDDEITEFPVVSNDYVGRPYRYSYNILYQPGEWLFCGLKKYDLQTCATQRFEYGPGRYGSEPQMARRLGATGEDDGYLLVYVTDMVQDRSEALVFDATDISRGPLATVILPERISVGVHACWVEGDRIHGEHRDSRMLP